MYRFGVGGFRQVTYDTWITTIKSRVSPYVNSANLIGLIGACFMLFCLLILPSSNYWNIRLPLYTIVIVWTFLRPRIALYLLPIAIPWGTADTVTIGGLHLEDILVGLLVVSWLSSFALRAHTLKEDASAGSLDREAFHAPRYLILTMFALILAMLVSTTVTSNLFLSSKELIKWLEAFVVLFLGMQYLRTRKQIWGVIFLLLLAAVSQALFGYIQYFFHLGPSSFIRDASLRVYGTFGQPNPYAGYLNMALVVAISLVLVGKTIITRLFAGITTILLAGAEILSQSKGGLLALTITILFIVILGFPHLRPFLQAGGVLLLGGLGAYITGVIPNDLLTPLMEKAGLLNISFTHPTNDNFANSERVAHWVAGLQMFRDHPFFGVGIGNYATAYAHYAPGIFTNSLEHAHNYYINMAAEAGIVGFLALLIFLLATWIAGTHAFRTVSQHLILLRTRSVEPSRLQRERRTRFLRAAMDDRALAIGLLAAVLSVCIHNLVDNLYVHGMTVLFALLVALLIRLAELTHISSEQ